MTGTSDHASVAADGRLHIRVTAPTPEAQEHARSPRTTACACGAQTGVPCSPSGDHLARYLAAERAGMFSKQALKNVIAQLDVIAPHVLIRPPEEPNASLMPPTTSEASRGERT